MRRCDRELANAEIDRGDGLELDDAGTKHLAAGIHERGRRKLAELKTASRRM